LVDLFELYDDAQTLNLRTVHWTAGFICKGMADWLFSSGKYRL